MFINDSKLLSRCALLGVALLGTACTFERGTAYASVESAQLDVRFDPGAARDLGGNTVLTDLGYAVHVSSFTLDIGDLSLQELKSSGSESQGSFDPANPPPGYSSCHGGHCHADDGGLVPYADIEAELAGSGGARFESIVSFHFDETVQTLEDPRLIPLDVDPSRELPRSHLDKAALSFGSVSVTASVRDVPDAGREASLTVELPVVAPRSHALDVAIDRDGPETLAIRAALTIDGAIFDGIDFESALQSQSLPIRDPDTTEARAFLDNMASAPFSLEVR